MGFKLIFATAAHIWLKKRMSVCSQIVQVSGNTSSGLLFTTEIIVTLDDLLYCRRIIQCAEVTQPVQVVLHHLPQHPAHYLA